MYIDNDDIPILQEIINEFRDEFQFFITDKDTNPSSMPKDWNLIVLDMPNLINDFNSEISMVLYHKRQDLCRYMDYSIFHHQAGNIGHDEVTGTSAKHFWLTIKTPLGKTIPMSVIGWNGNYWKILGRPALPETEELWKRLKKSISKKSILFTNKVGWKIYTFPNAMKKIQAGHPYNNDSPSGCGM